MVAECKQTMSSDGQPVPGVSPLSRRATWRVYSLKPGSHAPRPTTNILVPENVLSLGSSSPIYRTFHNHLCFRFIFRKPFYPILYPIRIYLLNRGNCRNERRNSVLYKYDFDAYKECNTSIYAFLVRKSPSFHPRSAAPLSRFS